MRDKAEREAAPGRWAGAGPGVSADFAAAFPCSSNPHAPQARPAARRA